MPAVGINSKSGLVSIEEFSDYLDVARSKFTDIIFGLLDRDKSGQLDFRGTQTQRAPFALTWQAFAVVGVSGLLFLLLPQHLVAVCAIVQSTSVACGTTVP